MEQTFPIHIGSGVSFSDCSWLPKGPSISPEKRAKAKERKRLAKIRRKQGR